MCVLATDACRYRRFLSKHFNSNLPLSRRTTNSTAEASRFLSLIVLSNLFSQLRTYISHFPHFRYIPLVVILLYKRDTSLDFPRGNFVWPAESWIFSLLFFFSTQLSDFLLLSLWEDNFASDGQYGVLYLEGISVLHPAFCTNVSW